MKTRNRRKELTLQELKDKQRDRKVDTFQGVCLKALVTTDSNKLAEIKLDDYEVVENSREQLLEEDSGKIEDYEQNVKDVYEFLDSSVHFSQLKTQTPMVRYDQYDEIPPDLTLKTNLEITSSSSFDFLRDIDAKTEAKSILKTVRG